MKNINKHEINRKRIQNYMGKCEIPSNFRVDRNNGGQYLENFLIEFAKFVRNETLNELITFTKDKRKL